MMQKSEKNIIIYGFLVLLIFISSIFFWISKSTFSITDEVNNQIIIDCPKSASNGEKIECKIMAKFINESKFLSVNANYNLDEGIIYDSFLLPNECDSDNCLISFANTKNGFAFGNINGFGGSFDLGYLNVLVSEQAVPNSMYKIGLNNIELTDSNYKMVDIDDVNIDVRIKSNIATLDDIKITNGSINEDFTSDRLNYTANVPSNIDNIIVSYTKTDDNSSASGNGTIGIPINLHYGDNIININITSENGKTTKEYVLKVRREYDFNTTKYKYNKDNNSLYVANDSDNVIISNLESLPDNLKYSISDNKLNIVYLEDVLCSIDLLRFTSDFDIVNKKIYIEKDLTYSKIIDKIKCVNLTIKVFDSKNALVKDDGTVINESNKISFFDGDKELDSFNFGIGYLEFNSELEVNNNEFIIGRLKDGMKYSELKQLIKTNGDISIIAHDNLNLTDNNIVRTGDKIKILCGNDEYVYFLSVLGDLTGDGLIRVNDVDRLYRRHKNKDKYPLNKWEEEAGDLHNDGEIYLSDVDKLSRIMKKKSYEVNNNDQ